MITSIFSKSKPTNLIIGFFSIALSCAFAYFKIETHALTYTNTLQLLGLVVLSCLGMLFVNFIASKNSLSKTNTLEVPLYSSFLLLIPESTSHLNIVIANLLILLGLRRIISLRSQKKIKNKLFDAALCITLASLCYAWSILFFLVIFLAVSLQTENKIRHWLIPLVGSITVYLIAYSVGFIVDYKLFEQLFADFQIRLDFRYYSTIRLILALLLLIALGLWASWFYFKSITQRKKAVRPAYYIIIVSFFIALVVNTVVLQKNGGALLFVFAPLSIIMSNYIDTLKKDWLKESFFGVFLIAPLVLLLLL